MKSIRSFTLLKLATASLVAIGFNAGLASAQTLTGKFTLPFEAHWGTTNLPAGDYSFTLGQIGPSATVHLFRGPETVSYIFSRSFDQKSTGVMSLTVMRTSDGNFVRDLNLPEIGVVLHYAPNQTGRGSAAKEREIARIPVTTGGK
jgi:hypothetical protein